MRKKIKILIIIGVLIGVIAAVYFGFIKKEKTEYSLYKVSKGTISQEVSETGTVKKGDMIKTGFKISGRIEKIYVKVGDKVKSGDPLAKLDTKELSLQLSEQKALLQVAKAQLNKLLTGASAEDIQLAKTSVANAQTSLQSAEQNLKDTEATAEENLKSAYEDTLNVLEDAYLKAYNAFETVRDIQLSYFLTTDQISIKVKESKRKIGDELNKIKSFLDSLGDNPSNEDVDSAILKTRKSLDNIFQELSIVRLACEDSLYRNIVSDTDKASLNTQKSNINTAITNLTNSEQTISLTKINNEKSINTAKSQVLLAKGDLKKAQDELSRLLAPPRKEDVDLYQAKVKQAQAKTELLEEEIREATLISPVDGQVADIYKKKGELVQLTTSVISLIPENPFQIEVNIYEEDIVKVKIGNLVDINLTAFPNKTLAGEVVSIDPAEKLIEGVVYYKVTVAFKNASFEKIKPGMTADITIETNSKKNVLIIPLSAVKKKNGETFVEVLKNKKIQERKIETGLEGNDDMVEVLSGLSEGETIIVK